jgi:hypothetical protein
MSTKNWHNMRLQSSDAAKRRPGHCFPWLLCCGIDTRVPLSWLRWIRDHLSISHLPSSIMQCASFIPHGRSLSALGSLVFCWCGRSSAWVLSSFLIFLRSVRDAWNRGSAVRSVHFLRLCRFRAYAPSDVVRWHCASDALSSPLRCMPFILLFIDHLPSRRILV